MNPWSAYESRISERGATKRESALKREHRYLSAKARDNLSYQHVLINGVETDLSVLNSDNLNIKTICTLPGDDFRCGSLVEWMGNHWLVIEKDANTEVYAKGLMKQCNHLLRWISADGRIVERWCIIEDGTKYLVGEYGDRNFVAMRGDTRISMTLAKDPDSVQLNRNSRFIIDDYDSDDVLAYRLTKPFRLGGSYNGEGVLNFVLTECNTEDSDNLELHIANYYDYFPREPDPGVTAPGGVDDGGSDGNIDGSDGAQLPGKKVWF